MRAPQQDLKPFDRDLMRQMESDLGTRLDWVPAYNVAHLIFSGERNLVVERDIA